jgi:glutathione S-transferase
MILFGLSVSPFARKVLMYAAERGLPVENRPLGPGADDPQFKAASPLGKIPAFADGDYNLADSSAILHYLEAKYPANGLIPAEPKARGKVVWFEEYADTVMFPAGTIVFFNRVVMPKIRKEQGNLAAADDAEKTKVPPVMAYLESCLAGDYLVGNSLTVADIAVVNQLINLEHGGVKVDAAKYPKLAAFYARMTARPSVAGIIAGERKFLGL